MPNAVFNQDIVYPRIKQEESMLETRYLKLTRNYYFDRLKKQVQKRNGKSILKILPDRRNSTRFVAKDRRDKMGDEASSLKSISQVLFWDSAKMEIYRKVGINYVLYSKDRRKFPGYSPTGLERRQAIG